MATTILQEVVARCRQDFTTTSATAVLVSGTQRRLSVTAGSYVDVVGTVACSVGAAADTFLDIFLDGAIIGEGASGSVGTAADYITMATQARIGPITTAQAAAGIVVDLRVAVSADTLTINATTTPTKYSAVLEAKELSITGISTPSTIPHLLLWLKADDGVTYNKTTNEVTAWADKSGSKTLAYNAQTGNFAAGLLLTGGTSAATAYIHNDTDAGATGTLLLTDVRGTFVAGEVITDSSTGSATVASAPADIVLTVGTSAPNYEASVVNSLPGVYFNGNEADNIAITTAMNQATSFVVLAVVSNSAFVNAGASFLNPPLAQSADCLRATLSNATVNRSALFDTNKPEYVGTATTVTSGKQIIKLRYNAGTTTGAGAVNGGSDTTDTSFDPPSFTWAFIGSSNGATFKLSDFRLCELCIYSFVQASTEDAINSSDIQAVRDYLNQKFLVY